MAKSKKKTEEILDDVQVELNDAQEETLVESVASELPVKEKNVEELLLAYIEKQEEGEDIELNEFFEKSYNSPDASMTAKLTYQLLTKLSYEGKIKMSNTNWNDLASLYYDESGKSKKYLLSDIKILAKK